MLLVFRLCCSQETFLVGGNTVGVSLKHSSALFLCSLKKQQSLEEYMIVL